MALKTFQKDADEVLDFSIDWSQWLGSDTIVSSTWTVPSGLTKDSTTNDTTSATVVVSGGTDGVTYNLVNRIITANGQTREASIDITLAPR